MERSVMDGHIPLELVKLEQQDDPQSMALLSSASCRPSAHWVYWRGGDSHSMYSRLRCFVRRSEAVVFYHTTTPLLRRNQLRGWLILKCYVVIR